MATDPVSAESESEQPDESVAATVATYREAIEAGMSESEAIELAWPDGLAVPDGTTVEEYVAEWLARYEEIEAQAAEVGEDVADEAAAAEPEQSAEGSDTVEVVIAAEGTADAETADVTIDPQALVKAGDGELAEVVPDEPAVDAHGLNEQEQFFAFLGRSGMPVNEAKRKAFGPEVED